MPLLRPSLRLVLALAVALGAVSVPAPAPVSAAGLTVQRFGGADRYATAALVSANHFAPGVAAAYVATGANFPDALAGGPAAARAGAPILLVKRGEIPAATRAELSRLRPGRIVVLGGSASVSDAVMTALGAYQTGGGVSRIGGADRYATAAAVSRATFTSGAVTAYVATGLTFPDALVGGAAAARAGSPVLLTQPSGLPASTETELRRLAPQRIVVLGGPISVSDGVVARLRTLATTGTVTRLAGADRYATAVAVSAATFPSGLPGLFVATGQAFPDALVAVPAAAKTGAALLLVPGSSVPSAVRAEAVRLRPSRLVLLGGMATMNERVTFDLRVALGDLAPLPACSYQDVLTRYRAYEDWHRTLVDTILAVPSDYHPPDLVDTASAGVNGGHAMRGHVTADLKAMTDAARAAGRAIQVVSAYRSYATQQTTFNYWVSVAGYEQALRTSARPGHSEHQLGTTFDFTSLGGRPPWEYADWAALPAGAWMAANAWRYGFVMSYPRASFSRVCYEYEPWHYRYVGRTAAAEVRASGLTLREWLWLRGSG
ncbi:MAG TPA: cell wall-binding repeat-containing protein [Patescibacteria group bacterium]|nr:cell wall-binding repeat-containing protein [Patescibacteria group bacterium]